MAHLPQQFGFILRDAFSPLAFAGASEVLQAANHILGHAAYEVAVLRSVDGQTDSEPPGLQCRSLGIDESSQLAALFVVAGRLPSPEDPALMTVGKSLARIAARHGTIGGIGAGAAWLAHADLLRGHRCTLDSQHAHVIAEQFPECIVSSNLYEIDRTRATCAGYTASLDMMIAWLGRRHGERIVHDLLMHFGLEKLRASSQRQRAAVAVGPSVPAKLGEAMSLMENNIGEPLSTEEIAKLVGVSRRQLERLFKQHLDALPSRWYIEQRLHRARSMLKLGSQSILQVGLSCGFSSGAHFSNAYRAYFNRTPRDERSARAAEWRSHPNDGKRSLSVGNPPEDPS
jgi:transcriptional regulator GlxA family with amidase domain